MRGHCYAWDTHSLQLPSAAGCGVSKPAKADCGAASGAAKFGNVAGAAERGRAGCRRGRGAVSGVVCQFRVGVGDNPEVGVGVCVCVCVGVGVTTSHSTQEIS